METKSLIESHLKTLNTELTMIANRNGESWDSYCNKQIAKSIALLALSNLEGDESN